MPIKGDVFSCVPTSIVDDGYHTIQPESGHEAVVHNIKIPSTKACELYATDGTNDILIDSSSVSWVGYNYNVTNTDYLRVKNVSGGTIYISHDGRYTKPASE